MNSFTLFFPVACLLLTVSAFGPCDRDACARKCGARNQGYKWRCDTSGNDHCECQTTSSPSSRRNCDEQGCIRRCGTAGYTWSCDAQGNDFCSCASSGGDHIATRRPGSSFRNDCDEPACIRRCGRAGYTWSCDAQGNDHCSCSSGSLGDRYTTRRPHTSFGSGCNENACQRRCGADGYSWSCDGDGHERCVCNPPIRSGATTNRYSHTTYRPSHTTHRPLSSSRSCRENEELTTRCRKANDCEPSCGNPYPRSCTRDPCSHPMCECKIGYFRDDFNNCVLRSQCRN